MTAPSEQLLNLPKKPVRFELSHSRERPTNRPPCSPGESWSLLDRYDLRSLIENIAFRELKQGWGLGRFPKKTLAAVRGHVVLTLLTFTLTNAFHIQQGQALTQCGIRRQRAETACGQVIIFAGDHDALFDMEEIFILMGVEPATGLRVDPAEVRRRYRLPPRLALPVAA